MRPRSLAPSRCGAIVNARAAGERRRIRPTDGSVVRSWIVPEGPRTATTESRRNTWSAVEIAPSCVRGCFGSVLWTLFGWLGSRGDPERRRGCRWDALRTWMTGLLPQYRTSSLTLADRKVLVGSGWAVELGAFEWW